MTGYLEVQEAACPPSSVMQWGVGQIESVGRNRPGFCGAVVENARQGRVLLNYKSTKLGSARSKKSTKLGTLSSLRHWARKSVITTKIWGMNTLVSSTHLSEQQLDAILGALSRLSKLWGARCPITRLLCCIADIMLMICKRTFTA